MNKRKALLFYLIITYLLALIPYVFKGLKFINDSSLFYNGVPIIQRPDGYFYARLSLNYSQIDFLRNYPEAIVYKFQPLISVIHGSLAKIFNAPVEWVGFFLSFILPLLFVFPIVVLFYINKKPLLGIFISIIVSYSPIYLSRNGILNMDTESLNLFFIFSNVLLLYIFYTKGNFTFLVISFINSFFFFWWYAHFEFIILQYIGLFILLIIDREFDKLRKSILYFILFYIVLCIWSKDFVGIDSIYRIIFYFFGDKTPYFNYGSIVYKTIGELQPTPIYSNNIIFAKGFLNILALIFSPIILIRYYRLSLLFLPLIVLTLILLVTNMLRIYVYALPIIAMGFYQLYEIVYLILAYVIKRRIILYLLTIFIFPLVLPMENFLFLSITKRYPKEYVETIHSYRNFIPKYSPIATIWDNGYFIQYYLSRPTFNDGGNQGNFKTFFISTALISDDEEKAYKAIKCIGDISFILQLKNKKFKSAEEFKSFMLNKLESSKCYSPLPIFVLITQDMLYKMPGIARYALLDKWKNFVVANLIFARKSNIVKYSYENGKISILIHNYFGKTKHSINYKLLIVSKREGTLLINGNKDNKSIVNIIEDNKNLYVNILNDEAFNTLLFKLFFFRKDYKHFKLVKDDFPYAVLYVLK